jgi:hypothetical protein
MLELGFKGSTACFSLGLPGEGLCVRIPLDRARTELVVVLGLHYHGCGLGLLMVSGNGCLSL